MAAVPSPAAPSSTAAPTGVDPSQTAPDSGRRPELRLVGPPRHTSRFVLAVGVVTVLAVFGIVSLHALAAEAAFEARALESEVSDLSDRQDELTVEVARLESLERIREAAVSDLGMVPAEQPGYLVLDGSSSPLDGPVGSRLAKPAAAPPAGG